MKNILIPIDLKFNSYDAIDYAANFFKHKKCHFYFLNTFTYDIKDLNAINLLQADDDWYEKPKQDSKKSLERAIQKYVLNNMNKEHRFSAISECADLVESMKKTIKEMDIDLVIIARKKQVDGNYKRYKKNTKRIIEQIRECPVMIIPSSTHIQKYPEFVLVSNFKVELPKVELENWLELVEIVKGNVKIMALTGKEQMTQLQKANQNRVQCLIEKISKPPVIVEYLKTTQDLKNFAEYSSDYIICLMDRKPSFWRKCGLTHSLITNLGPLQNTPLIALHR
ncbi:universal stress protein [Aquimarina muelleri]|uniref:Universal stress protein family protein n=1 Tax=Aquimarina muelleri TaxID=279356 RepID=A0A918N0Z3_9FLAO|nr:hypothetical protein [Aquimarina muelleri]MCX2763108.1 universal stress protein [Aquimarina muelleri]GGX06607.1 hypothetical protein GCM10007384_05400 [Aquimarina muelleri]